MSRAAAAAPAAASASSSSSDSDDEVRDPSAVPNDYSNLFPARQSNFNTNVKARFDKLLSNDRARWEEDGLVTTDDRKAYMSKAILEELADGDFECPYCNISISRSNFSLDRIDNAQAHLPENCLIVCHPCNKARGDSFTHEECTWPCATC